jgi:PAS domain S-box-containing protein
MQTDGNLNEQLLDLVSDSIMVNDLNGRFLYVNKTAYESRGYTKKELMDTSLHDLNTVEFSPYSDSRLQQVLKTGVNVFEAAHYRKDRSIMPVEVHARVINLGDQKAVISIVIDITERKQNEARLKESELKQQSILDNIPDIAWMKDLNSRFIAVNQSMATSVATNIQDMIGKTDLDFYPREIAEKYMADDLKVVKSGQRKTIEETYVGSDKKTIWIETIKTPLFDEKGKVSGTIGIARNITKRRHVEEKLRESEQRFRDTADLLPVIAFEADLEGRLIYVNNLAFSLFGYTKEEFTGRQIFDFIAPEDRQRSISNALRVLKGEFMGNNEYTAIRKDGSRLSALIQTAPMKNQLGQLIGSRGILADISSIKEIENNLRASEQRFRELADLLPVVATEVDTQGNLTYVNKKAFYMFGYTKDELMKMNIFDLVAPEEKQLTVDRAQRVIEGEELGAKEFTIIKKDGSRLSTLVQTAPIKNEHGKLIGSRGVMIDITAQKKTENDLRASEQIFRTFFEQTQDGIILLDSQGRVIAWNAAHERFSGIKKEDILGKRLWEYEGKIHPDQNNNRQVMDTEIKRLLKTKQSPLLNKSTEFVVKTPDGKAYICLSSLLLIETGNDFMIGSITRDITDIRRIEKDLQLSEQKYRTLVENVRLGIFRTTVEDGGKFIEGNKAAEEITGYSRDQLLKIAIKDLYASPENRNRFITQIISSSAPASFDTYFRKKDGTIISVSITAKAIRNKAGKVISIDGTLEDITERKLLEERIMDLYEKEKKQREELQEEARTRGMFIDVLAHELRTPLTPILVSTGMLNDFLSNRGGFEGKLTTNIYNSAQVLSNRLEELLEIARYSRGTFKLQTQPVDTTSYLEEVTSHFKMSVIQTDQTISFEIARDLPVIKIDRSRLEQVINNLLSNACKFSPPNGKVSLRACMKANRLQVEVQDEGIGISPEESMRIFQPYHRVEQDRLKFPGLGLGLAVAKQIIEAHGGRIWVSSQLNKGSTFCFELPVNQG